MDVSWAVGITTHVSDALNLSYFHFLSVSSTELLTSVESFAALVKSWDSWDTFLLNSRCLTANSRNLGDLHGLLLTKGATEC